MLFFRIAKYLNPFFVCHKENGWDGRKEAAPGWGGFGQRGEVCFPVGTAGERFRREAGPTIRNVRHRAVSHETTPLKSPAGGKRVGSGANSTYHIIKHYERSWKSFETAVAAVSTRAAPLPGLAKDYRRQAAGLSDQAGRECSTLRTRFHSTYIKHKPELTDARLSWGEPLGHPGTEPGGGRRVSKSDTKLRKTIETNKQADK